MPQPESWNASAKIRLRSKYCQFRDTSRLRFEGERCLVGVQFGSETGLGIGWGGP